MKRLAIAAVLLALLIEAPPQEVFAAVSSDLDQCGNGPFNAPVACTGSAWKNGNLNASEAHYLEGQSTPYRLRIDGLTASTEHTVTIEWDTLTGGKHTIDYLTSYDRTETDTVPCSAVPPATGYIPNCDPSVYDTEPIPVDPEVTKGADGVLGTSDDIVQIPGVFTLFGGTITAVSAYATDFANGDHPTSVTISFTADVVNPVLAWGGHISTRLDWGVDNSAIATSGSPYHMRFIDIDGMDGNQNLSLSAAAVIYPAKLKIIKDTAPDAPTDFDFTTTGPEVSPFTLDDDDDPALSNSIEFPLLALGSMNTRTVTEALAAGLMLTGLVCTEDPGGVPQDDNSTTDLGTRTATIIAEYGELITCTFTNTRHFFTLPFVVWPYYVVDGWGEYTGGCGGSSGAHWGIDYGAEAHAYLDCWQLAQDATIVAASGGEAMASSGGGYGNFVLIWHGNGYSTLYAHLDRYANVFDGHVCPDKQNCTDWVSVERGRVIGYAGQTDTFYRHLHFEVAKNAAIDPASRYAEHCVSKLDPYDLSIPGDIQDRDHYPDADSRSESCGPEHLWQNCPPTLPGLITLTDLTQLVEPLAEKWLTLGTPSLLRLIVTVLWPGSDIDVTLISPGGRTITCPTADPDVVCDQSATSTTITLDTPEIGEWMIRLFGADVPPGGEQVSLVATGEPIPMSVAVGGIAEPPQLEPGPLRSGGAPARDAFALALGVAGGALLLTTGGWYARRRWLCRRA